MEKSMRHLLAVGAFALTTGMAMAIPSHADDYYIKDGDAYRYDDNYVPYQRTGTLTQSATLSARVTTASAICTPTRSATIGRLSPTSTARWLR